MSENKENDLMMKKKTVRLISGAVAGILVGAMLVSVVASGIVYAGAASSSEQSSSSASTALSIWRR